jgi:hypothetical protein
MMTSPFWRRWIDTVSPSQKPGRPSRLGLERLEDRTAPAVALSYAGAGSALTLTEPTAGATTVTISETTGTAPAIKIDLGSGFFAATSSTGARLTYSGSSPSTSHWVLIASGSPGSISTLTANLTGDTLTIGAIRDLSGGLGNLSATAGTITVSGVIDTTSAAAGQGNVTLTAARSIHLASSGITTQDGTITLTANQGATPQTGNFAGIDIDGAVVQTRGTGGIRVQGTGGNDANTGAHFGINIHNHARVATTGTGMITLLGTGGTGPGGFNAGVMVQAGGEVSSVNSGASITVQGTGGQGGSSDSGLIIDATHGSAVVTSKDADLSLFGIGGTGSDGHSAGVVVQGGGHVTSTGAGNIYVTGTGGQGGSGNYGLAITGSGSLITAGSASITLVGSGGQGSDGFNTGVLVQAGGKVASTGTSSTASLGINGTGGQGGGNNRGVAIDGTFGMSQVTAVGGSISITGTGGTGTGDYNAGVLLLGGGQVTSTASLVATPIILNGNGGTGSRNDFGVDVDTSSLVSSATGNILLQGQSSDTTGVAVQNNGAVSTPGTLTINGDGGAQLLGSLSAAAINVSGGAGNDLFNVQLSGGSGNISIDGKSGNDTYYVLPLVARTITVSDSGGDPGDILNDLGWGQLIRTGPTSGVITNPEMGDISFSNIATVQVASTTGGDTDPVPVQERFIQALYHAVLGRTGSTAEIDGWLPLLGSQGRRALVTALTGSTEAEDRVVRGWYSTYLGRQAVGGEENGFVAMLQAGQSEEQALSLLLGSQEFFNHTQTLSTTGTPQERLVKALYQLVLNRSATAGEVAGWAGFLSAGGTAQQAALGFLQSQEFRARQFTSNYTVLLHRPPSSDPTSADQRFLTSLVLSSMDLRSARIVFESSAEFYISS